MKKVTIEILILLLVSSFIIFFQFNQVPKKLSWDEVEFTRLALSLDDKPYTPYSQLATGHSTLYFYIILASIKIFGLNNFAIRFPSALFGILNILLFYFITRIAISKITYFKKHFLRTTLIPFFLSFILITSRWYFNFTRFSFEVTFLLFLELCAIYFFFKIKTSAMAILIMSAIFSGLAFHSYYPGRIFFLLPLLFLLLNTRKNLLIRFTLIFLITFIVIISPLVFYLLSHKDIRVQEQLFLTNNKLSISKKIAYIGENVISVVSMFNLRGDLNGRHNYPGKPMLNPVVGAFFILGFLVVILNLKSFYNKFFVSYFFIALLPTLFTYPAENPNSLRSYTAIIPSIFFVGNGIIYLLQSENRAKNFYYLVIIGLIILFFLSALYDLRTYFVYQRQVFRKSFELPGGISKILKLKLWEKTNHL